MIKIKKSHQGLLHKNLGVKAGNKIPAGKLAKAKNSKSAAVRKRATFAENAKHWNHSGKKKKHKASAGKMSPKWHRKFNKTFS